jgi:enamine deaminase RidA (YjgF/YER057c/UK114 family)
MTQARLTGLTLADLDSMNIEEARLLPFDERDRLLDLVIADGRHYATDSVSYRTGMYSDYFEEDLTRMLKVKAVKVYCRGTTPSDFDGVPVGENYTEQYRACLTHVETILSAARTGYGRVIKLIVFLTNMDLWNEFNKVYREFISNPPCRAVIGTTGLAQKPLAIEVVECVAYRVAE